MKLVKANANTSIAAVKRFIIFLEIFMISTPLFRFFLRGIKGKIIIPHKKTFVCEGFQLFTFLDKFFYHYVSKKLISWDLVGEKFFWKERKI